MNFQFVTLTLVALFACGVFKVYKSYGHKILRLSNDSTATSLSRGNSEKAVCHQNDLESYHNITPLPDFDWRITEPLKFRNFNSKYHLTMGISKTTFSSFLEFDKTYLSRITLRKQIIDNHHSTVIQADPTIKPAIDELYTWLVTMYLPTRFPLIFRTSSTQTLTNHATGLSLPRSPPSDPKETLGLLGSNLDEEFLLLLPDKEGDYVLRGYVTCFPSGFDTREKFGKKLREIHEPVPGYKAKLEKSMDRFFSRLEVGKVVLRSNWSIQTHERLFVPTGNHLYEGQSETEEVIDVANTHLRCERQLLHRLPNSKAIVFSFKTYLYNLQEIKDEGLGSELADAIDGLKMGSVPEMNFYKKGVVWGAAVKKFLRSRS